MITLSNSGAYLINGTQMIEAPAGSEEQLRAELGDKYISKEEKEKIFNKFNIWDCKDIDYFSN